MLIKSFHLTCISHTNLLVHCFALRETKEEELKGNHRYLDSALFLFGPDNPVRKFCQRIVDARYEYATHQSMYTRVHLMHGMHL